MMRLDQPHMLWLALLALPMLIAGWRILADMDVVRRLLALSIRAVLVGTLSLTLAAPRTVRKHDHLTVIAAVDVSGSVRRFVNIPPLDPNDRGSTIDAIRQWLRNTVESRQPEDRFGLVVFDGRAVAIATPTRGRYVDDNMDIREAPGTNIAEAIELASAMFPPDTAKRLLLVTDGNETIGDALEASRRTTQLLASYRAGDTAAGIVPIDVVPLAYRIARDVQIASVQTEPTARPGQTITARIVLEATAPSRGRLTMTNEGVVIDINGSAPGTSREITVPAGQSVQLVQITLPEDAAVVNRFQATFEPFDPETDQIAENNTGRSFTITPGRGSILIVNRHGSQRQHLLAQWLNQSGLDVQLADPAAFPRDLLGLHSHDLVVLDNVGAYEFDASQHELIRQYVEDFGGGLIMVGGENSFGAGGWNNTPVEQVLPLELDPPRELRLPTAALVLVIDKSGSMDFKVAGARATQQEIANQGAAMAVRSLRSESLVAVITFDLRARVVVPLQPNTEPQAIADEIMRITPEGGTNLEPALALAFRLLENVEVARKRVVCLSDGESEADPAQLERWARRMNEANIRVSTIAIGDEADRATLEMIATTGGGDFYEVRNPQVLPRVLIDSVQVINKPLIKETPFVPRVLPTGSSLTAGMDRAPELRGMVITAPKRDPRAVVELTHSDSAAEPLLAHWQVGLGRIAAFTSDLDGPWSRNWTDWDTARAFWLQLVRLITRPPQSRDAELFVDIRDDRLQVALEAAEEGGGRFADHLLVDSTVYTPDNQVIPLRLRQVAPGRYEGSIPVNEAGNYIVAAVPKSGQRRLAPTIGGASLASSPEFRHYHSNLGVLEQIVELTGGRRLDMTQPDAAGLFDREGMPPGFSALPAWPRLFWLLLGLVLLDVACRRLAWNWQMIRAALVRAIAIVTPSHVRARRATASLARLRQVSEQLDQQAAAQARTDQPLDSTRRPSAPPHRFIAEAPQQGRAEASKTAASVNDALQILRGRSSAPSATSKASSNSPEVVMPSPDSDKPKKDASSDHTSGLLAAKRRAQQRYKTDD